MVVRSSGKFLKSLSKLSNRSYSKCQKGLDEATEYIFIFQKIVHNL